MKFYYQAIDDATLSYSGTAVSGYPITNLQDRNIKTLFKDTGISTGFNLDIDLGSARACSHILLDGIVLSGTAAADAGFNLYGDDNSGFTTPETILSAESLVGSNPIIKTFTSATYRYWRIKFYDPTVSGGTFDLTLANIFLGTLFELSRNPNIDETEGFLYSSELTEALGGGRFGFGNHDDLRQTWNYNFDYISETDKTGLKAMVAGTYGSRRPFYFTDQADTVHYSRLMDDLSIAQIAYQAYTLSIALEQEI